MPTAKSRITELLEKSKEWCTQSEIAEALNIVSSRCSVDLKALIEEGAITAVKPPPGRNRGAQAIYNIAGVAAPEGSQPYAPRKTPGKPKKPAKLKGFKATARAKKKRAAASAKAASAIDSQIASETLYPDTLLVPTKPPRWAYTSEGALLLMDTGYEINPLAASSLIQFVRGISGLGA